MAGVMTGTDLARLVVGSDYVEEQPSGALAVHRLSPQARQQTNDPLFAFVEACPTGVTLRFVTSADRVMLTIATTTIVVSGQNTSLVSLVARQDGHDELFVIASPTTITVSGEGMVIGVDQHDPETVAIPVRGATPVEVFLPHNANVELVSLESPGTVEESPVGGFRWTHYGSSISHGSNADAPTRTWPVSAATTLGWTLRNLAFSGNAQLDGFVARMIRDIPADLITLKVGINLLNADSMRERAFLPATHAFIDTIREGQPSTPIVVISAISCPFHENAPGPVMFDADGQARAAKREVENDLGALTLARTREILAEVVRSRSDPALRYFDGRELLGDADVALLYDGLHPNQEGLDLMAQRFVQHASAFTG